MCAPSFVVMNALLPLAKFLGSQSGQKKPKREFTPKSNPISSCLLSSFLVFLKPFVWIVLILIDKKKQRFSELLCMKSSGGRCPCGYLKSFHVVLRSQICHDSTHFYCLNMARSQSRISLPLVLFHSSASRYVTCKKQLEEVFPNELFSGNCRYCSKTKEVSILPGI